MYGEREFMKVFWEDVSMETVANMIKFDVRLKLGIWIDCTYTGEKSDMFNLQCPEKYEEEVEKIVANILENYAAITLDELNEYTNTIVNGTKIWMFNIPDSHKQTIYENFGEKEV